MNDFYYIFSKNLIGVKTNQSSFSWPFGESQKSADKESFDNCLIKVNLSVVPDKLLKNEFSKCDIDNRRFSYFAYNSQEDTVMYSKTLFKFISLLFRVKIQDNQVIMDVGTIYYKLVKNKVMNIHSVSYMLFDIVTMLLLKNGIVPIYAATLIVNEKEVMIWGPPKSGKSSISLDLIKNDKAILFSEDISLTDGNTVWAVPYTNTFGQHSRKRKLRLSYKIEHIGVLDSANISCPCIVQISDAVQPESEYNFLMHQKTLNKYLFHYRSSPICIVWAYFHGYDLDILANVEDAVLKEVISKSKIFVVPPYDFEGKTGRNYEELLGRKTDSLIE